MILLICRYNKSTAQLLIRWCLERGFVCIPKSVKEQRIIENGDVFDFKISDEDMQVLVCSYIINTLIYGSILKLISYLV